MQVIRNPALQSGGGASEEGGSALLWAADSAGADPTGGGLPCLFWQSGRLT